MRAAFTALLIPVLAVAAAAGQGANSILNTPRQAVEKADFRATGHLVRVDPSGARTSYPINLKGHWFPGVLRVLLEVSKPSGSTPAAASFVAVHVLLELRPTGQPTIKVAHPGDAAATLLPSERWTEGLAGTGFAYEDFLDEQYFWAGQSVTEHVKYGARDTDLVKSTPGPSDRSGYTDVRTWLDSGIGFPVYVEKTLKQKAAPVREYTYFGLRHEGGVWSANQIEEKNHGQTGSTLLIIDRGSPKANLTLGDFSAEKLTRFP
jgi:hypothetical protein